MTEAEFAAQQEHFEKWWSDKLAEEVMMESSSSEEEINSEDFDRHREKQQGKQTAEELESLPISSSSSDTDSEFEVIDSNTYCTLYANGKFVAHKEEALLPGVVEKVGVRYKLEWRQTYASVWVRRTPEWTCFPKPDYPDGVGIMVPRPSNTLTEIVLKPPSLKRRAVDWFMGEARRRRRTARKNRVNRVRRYVLVEDKGTQTDGLIPDAELETLDVGRAVKRFTPFDRGAGNENERVPVEEETVAKLTEPGFEGQNRRDDMVVDQQSCQLPEILRSNPDSKFPEEVNNTEEARMANEEVIILGWKHDDQGGECSEHTDRHECEAMEEYRKRFQQDASLLRLDERILGLRLEIQMMESAQRGLVRGDDLRTRKMELHRLWEEWEVAINQKKESLRAEIEEWDMAMDRLALDDVMGIQICSLRQTTMDHPGKPSSCGMENRAGPTIVPVYAPPEDPVVPQADHLVASDIEAMKEDTQGKQGTHVQPLTMPSAISLLFDAINEPRNRPQALNEMLIKEAVEQLRGIQAESNRVARRQHCEVFRDFFNGLQGVPEYVGDLHEELLHLAEEDARKTREDETQEARVENADPPPFFIFRSLKGCSFDSSEEDEEWREAWREDRHTSLEPPSSDDHGSSSS
ncbi:hypothetical protein MLD38_027848 [Melastoma candidum]|uniref:Uncharacterized protein n=1 Tax=Melastoma candidum TaxID=119954 RepID=A0ACB9P4H1_9MYRT|nr:hypothetical protein MLD38_027848 [Melastoma candidum]